MRASAYGSGRRNIPAARVLGEASRRSRYQTLRFALARAGTTAPSRGLAAGAGALKSRSVIARSPPLALFILCVFGPVPNALPCPRRLQSQANRPGGPATATVAESAYFPTHSGRAACSGRGTYPPASDSPAPRVGAFPSQKDPGNSASTLASLHNLNHVQLTRTSRRPARTIETASSTCNDRIAPLARASRPGEEGQG